MLHEVIGRLFLPPVELLTCADHLSNFVSLGLTTMIIKYSSFRMKLYLFPGLLLIRLGLWNFLVHSVWNKPNETEKCTSVFSRALCIRNDSTYQDRILLEKVYRESPVAMHYCAIGGADRANPYLCFQPCSGWCGFATVNSAMLSMPLSNSQSRTYIGYKERGAHISLSEIKGLLCDMLAHPNAADLPFSQFDVFSAEYISLTDWQEHLRLSNDPSYRYIVLFHRAPLFFNDFADGKIQKKVFFPSLGLQML